MLPEALHQVTIVMSDRGIPASYRHMHGFGSHTYSLINSKGKRVWVKYHWRTQQGIKNLSNEKAAHLIAHDRESPDKLLQGRLFSYGDAHRYRLGVNHDQIPVNRPRCPMHSYHRDGLMRVDGNEGATKGYSPNSIGEWKTRPSAHAYSPIGSQAIRHSPYEDRWDDCFYQPGNLYRLMTEDKRSLLIKNTAVDMMPVTYNIKYRHTAHCYLADKEYGTRLAEAMNLDMVWVEHLASLSEEERLKITSN